jgi:anti-sigma factor RsiW
MTILAYVPGTYAWRRRREGILCAKTVERIQEIVDGEIGPGRAEQVLKRHLEACGSCNERADVIRDLKAAIARVSDEADPKIVRNLEDLARKLCQGEGSAPAE